MPPAQLYWFSPIRTAESLASFNALTGIGYGGSFILYAVGAALFLAQQVTHLPMLHAIVPAACSHGCSFLSPVPAALVMRTLSEIPGLHADPGKDDRQWPGLQHWHTPGHCWGQGLS